MQQQDSHELLNYLLNTIADLLAGNTQHVFVIQAVHLQGGGPI